MTARRSSRFCPRKACLTMSKLVPAQTQGGRWNPAARQAAVGSRTAPLCSLLTGAPAMQSRQEMPAFSGSAARDFVWGTHGLSVRKRRTLLWRARRPRQAAAASGQTASLRQRCLPMELVPRRVRTRRRLQSQLTAAMAPREYSSRAARQQRIGMSTCHICIRNLLPCCRISQRLVQLLNRQQVVHCTVGQQQLQLQAHNLSWGR